MGQCQPHLPASICRTVYFSGRVQGVGFRYVTCHLARGFKVRGYVRNLADGRVELVAEGPAEQVEGLVAALKQEMGGLVTGVQAEDRPATGAYPGFDIRF